MTREINWPAREEWQAKAEHAARTSCVAHERVSADPADWLTAQELADGHALAAKVVRATRTALGKAGRGDDRYALNDANRRTRTDYADFNDVAYGWAEIARTARSVNALPEATEQLAALAEKMRTARDEAAQAAEEAAVAKAIAERATDEGWKKELKRRARVERGPQVTTITVHEDGSTEVSGPVPFRPPWPSN